jgi:hypothetical protein
VTREPAGAADPWGALLERPRFVMTSDQDWAPDWAVEHFLGILRQEGVPLHLFVTNPCPAVERARTSGDAITLGMHPNFREGSTHGSTVEEVVDHCKSLAPGATSFRTHTFAENATILQALRRAGCRADSNLCLLHQPRLVPLFHGSGLLRFPVFFEDDVFWNAAPGLDLHPLRGSLFSPGLKVLNFHPLFVAGNVPSDEFYAGIRSSLFTEEDVRKRLRFSGRGTEDVLRELIRTIRAGGGAFESFEAVVDEAFAALSANRPDYLYESWFKV